MVAARTAEEEEEEMLDDEEMIEPEVVGAEAEDEEAED